MPVDAFAFAAPPQAIEVGADPALRFPAQAGAGIGIPGFQAIEQRVGIDGVVEVVHMPRRRRCSGTVGIGDGRDRRSRLAGRRFRFRHAMTHLRVIHLRMVHLRLIRKCRRRLRVVHPGVIHPGVIHLRMIHLRLIGRRRRRHRVAHLRMVHPGVIDLLRECRCGCDQGKRKEHRLHAMPSPTCTVRIIPASMWYSRWQW